MAIRSRNTLTEPSGEPISLWDRTFGAAKVGARRDPAIGWAMDRLANEFPSLDPKVVRSLEARLTGDRLADVFEIIGEYGPSFAAGAGLWGLGRRAAVAGLRALAPRIATLGPRAASQASKVAMFAAQSVPGAEVALTGAPGIQRAAEIAGGAAGLGLFSGAEAAFETDDPRDIALQAALGAGAGAAGELAFMGLGKVLAPYTKSSVLLSKAKAGTGTPKFMSQLEEFEAGTSEKVTELRGALSDLRKGMSDALGIPKYAAALQEAGIPGRPRVPRDNIFTDEVKALQEKMVAKKVELRAAETVQRGLSGLMRFKEIPTSYTRETPLNPDTFGIEIQRILAHVAKTPEAFQGQLGVTANKFLSSVKEIEIGVRIAEAQHQVQTHWWNREAKKVLGRSGFHDKFLEQLEAYEMGGVGAVRPELQQVFGEIDNKISSIFGRLVQLGGETPLDGEALRRMGVKRMFPHMHADITEDAFEKSFMSSVGKHLVGKGMDPEAAQVEAGKVLERSILRRRDGIAQFGAIDTQRAIPGSLRSKLAAGMPFEKDPFRAMRWWMDMATRRIQYGERFGMNGELRPAIKKLAEAEGADRALVNTLVDNFLGHKYVRQTYRKWARNALNLQIASKMTLGVIPNLSGFTNIAVFNGFRKLFQPMWKRLSEEESQHLETALGLHEGVFQIMRRSMSGIEGHGVLDKFADYTLSLTQFSRVEQLNRMWGGASGYFSVKDTIAKAMGGRLRGNNLEYARRRLRNMGVDLDEVVRRGGQLTEGESLRAMYRAAQETQFVPEATRKPVLWNHPLVRILTQFKTFALGQGRFMRDQVIGEAARGNMAPLAHALAIYPLVGNMVTEAMAFVKDKPREGHGMMQYLDGSLATGWAGILQQSIIASRYGRLPEFFMGPTASDMTGFAEGILTADMDKVTRQVTRLPAVDAANFLLDVGGYTWEEYLSKLPTEGQPGPAETLEDLRRRAMTSR